MRRESMKREPTAYEKTSAKRIRQLIDDYCDGKQIVFAEKVGIGKASVSQYVNETNYPTNMTCGLIAKVFNVNPMWVMGFDVPKQTPPEQQEIVDGINTSITNRQRWLNSITDQEIRILCAYRNAFSGIQNAVDKLLDVDNEDSMLLAAHQNESPDAGDSDFPENDIESMNRGDKN